MINDLDMQSWAYLLDPTFQFVNTAGKPLTEGYLEVYIAGTRNKYYCACDFDGTLHPFQIPLDSLGSNIVLADPNQAYDVYVYNRFGSLIMSRYNVSPGNTGSGGVSMTTVTSQDNTINITHSGNNYDLSIKDTIDRIDNLEAQYGNLGASTDYAVSYGYGDGGEFVLTDKASTGINYLNDMSGWRLKPGHVYQLNYNAKFTCDEQTNKLVDGKFYLDGNMSFSQDWNFNLDDSYDYTESFNGSTIIVVPSTLQYYDLKLKYTFNSIVNCQVDLENISIVDITSTTNMGGGGAVYHAGDGININNNFISVDMDYINEQIDASSILSSAYNYTDVSISQASGDLINIIAEATANIPPQVQSDWSQDDDTQVDYIKNKPNLDIYATHDEVETTVTNVVSSVSSVLQNEIDNIPEQVQSNWTEDDTNDPSYILNKPNELELVAGENISIVESSGILTISASSPDLSDYATHNEVYNSSVSAINSANSYTDTAIANIDLTPAVEIVSPNNTISVSSVVNSANNTKTFYIDTNDPDTNYWLGEARLTLSDQSTQGQVGYYKEVFDYATKFNGNLDETKLKKGLYLFTANLMIVADEINNDIAEIQIISNSTSAISNAVSIYQHDCSIVGDDDGPGEESHQIATIVRVVYDDTPMSLVARLNAPTYISNSLHLWFSDICLYELQGTSAGGGTTPSASSSYDAGWGIVINGNVISVNPNIIPDVSSFATETYVNNRIASAVNIIESEIPDVSNLATKVELNTASGNIINYVNDQIGDIPEQVQSDWNEINVSLPSYIKNKPIESQLIPGDNISITASGSDYVISSRVVEQVNANWNETDPTDPSYIENKPDLSVYATNTTLGEVSGNIVSQIPDVSNLATKSELQSVSAAIPDPVSGASGVKVEDSVVSLDNPVGLVAGDNITISVSGSSAVIASQVNSVPSTTSLDTTKHYYLAWDNTNGVHWEVGDLGAIETALANL